MKYLENYKLFESDTNYSIYSFYQQLEYTISPGKIGLDYDWGKRWSDHFIGEGIFDKVVNNCKSMRVLFDKIEWGYLNEVLQTRMNDNLSISEVGIEPVYRYADWHTFFTSGNEYVKRGILPANEKCCDVDKMICRILTSIIKPTLSIKKGGSITSIRTKDEMRYVTNDLYKCVNFDAYKWGINWNDDFYPMRHGYQGYNVDLLVDSFTPAAFITIGDEKNSPEDNISYLKDLEYELDEYMSEISDYMSVKSVISDFRNKINGVVLSDKVPYYEVMLDLNI